MYKIIFDLLNPSKLEITKTLAFDDSSLQRLALGRGMVSW